MLDLVERLAAPARALPGASSSLGARARRARGCAAHLGLGRGQRGDVAARPAAGRRRGGAGPAGRRRADRRGRGGGHRRACRRQPVLHHRDDGHAAAARGRARSRDANQPAAHGSGGRLGAAGRPAATASRARAPRLRVLRLLRPAGAGRDRPRRAPGRAPALGGGGDPRARERDPLRGALADPALHAEGRRVRERAQARTRPAAPDDRRAARGLGPPVVGGGAPRARRAGVAGPRSHGSDRRRTGCGRTACAPATGPDGERRAAPLSTTTGGRSPSADHATGMGCARLARSPAWGRRTTGSGSTRPRPRRSIGLWSSARRLDDAFTLALALRFLGDIAINVDADLERAEALLDRSLAAAEELGEPMAIVRTLLFAGWVPWTRGDNEEAAAIWQRALTVAEPDDDWARVRALNSLSINLTGGAGDAPAARQRAEEALVLSEEASAIAEAAGDQFSIAVTAVQRARVLADLDRSPESLPCLDRRDRDLRRARSPLGVRGRHGRARHHPARARSPRRGGGAICARRPGSPRSSASCSSPAGRGARSAACRNCAAITPRRSGRPGARGTRRSSSCARTTTDPHQPLRRARS